MRRAGILLEMKNVCFAYDSTNKERLILKDINLRVGKREIVVIIGPSGCGKSTLLKVVSTLEKPSSGKILFEGREISPEILRESKLGLVPQSPPLYPWRTVLQNVMLPLELRHSPKKTAIQKAREALELVGLSGKENSLPCELSGGEKQRVVIAALLTLEISLMLMDEPFGAIDAINRDRLNLALLQIWQEVKNSIIFVTHNIEEAIFLASKVVVLKGKPAEITEKIEIPFAAKRNIELKKHPVFVGIADHLRRSLVGKEE